MAQSRHRGSSVRCLLRGSKADDTVVHYAAALIGSISVASLVGAAMCSAFERGSHDRWP